MSAAAATHPYEELLGTTVSGKSGPVPVSSFATKTLGLYFSAHWCPPCRGFTPKLAAFYREYNASHPGELEIVFVSSDKSEAEFTTYYGEHPWLALPFADRARKGALSSKYKVKGIPTLVLLAPSGEVLTTKGTEGLRSNPSGAGFPWAEPPEVPVTTLLAGATYVNSKGEAVAAASVVDHDYILIYFSAHWCGPCRAFTPRLSEWYTAHHVAKRFEIVFASGDEDEDSFAEYKATMPWVSLTFNHPAIKQLNDKYEVEGIPTLVLIKRDGTLVTTDARSLVGSAPLEFPWPPKPCEPLETAMSFINEQKTALLLLDKLTDDAALISVSDAYTTVATELFDEAKLTAPTTVRFAIGAPDDAGCGQLRNAIGLSRDRDGPTSLRLVIVDVPAGRKYVWGGAGVPTADDIKAFVAGVVAGTAASVGLRE